MNLITLNALVGALMAILGRDALSAFITADGRTLTLTSAKCDGFASETVSDIFVAVDRLNLSDDPESFSVTMGFARVITIDIS